MSTVEERYLRWLRVESPLSIVTIIAITASAVVSRLIPDTIFVTVAILFLAMVTRAVFCTTQNASLSLLFPAWPAFVAVNGIKQWMQRMGFGVVFRVSVTSVLFAACWQPLLQADDAMSILVLIAMSAATAALRELRAGYWYLAPSFVLTFSYLRMMW